MTGPTTPGAGLGLRSLPNLRDLGGWPAAGGHVRRGVLYRSTELHELAGPDVEAVSGLGLRTIFDLRTAAERADRPDRAPAGVRDVPLDVLADMSGAAQLPALLEHPAQMRELLGEGGPEELFGGAYRDIVRLPSALDAYRTMFTELADARHVPAATPL